MRDLTKLPDTLPIPTDDGATKHLEGFLLRDNIILNDSDNNLFGIPNDLNKKAVLFIFPKAGSPLQPNNAPEEWDAISGARGCTPQSCGYRDLVHEFSKMDVSVLGLSVQPPEVLKEIKTRNSLNYTLLSDSEYKLTHALKLPTFSFQGEHLIKRMAFYIDKNRIMKVFYPVFPPDQSADEVLNFLKGKIIHP